MSNDLPDYAHARVPYERSELRRTDLPDDPFAAFEVWFAEAQQFASANPNVIREVNAFVLSTANEEGYPSSRVVLLKDHDSNGFTLFTNRNSQKGREAEANPHASMLFFWEALERQIRIEGSIGPTSDETSDAYFAARSRGSQLSSAASPQSSEVESREALEALRTRLADRTGDDPVVRPPHWGGLRVRPTRFEFWQGRPDRFHDRIIFVSSPEGWSKRRIAP